MVLCKLLNANAYKKSTSQNKAGAFRESLSINKLQGKDFEEVEFTFYYANTVTFLHALKDLFKLEGISKVTGINAAQLGHLYKESRSRLLLRKRKFGKVLCAAYPKCRLSNSDEVALFSASIAASARIPFSLQCLQR